MGSPARRMEKSTPPTDESFERPRLVVDNTPMSKREERELLDKKMEVLIQKALILGKEHAGIKSKIEGLEKSYKLLGQTSEKQRVKLVKKLLADSQAIEVSFADFFDKAEQSGLEIPHIDTPKPPVDTHSNERRLNDLEIDEVQRKIEGISTRDEVVETQGDKPEAKRSGLWSRFQERFFGRKKTAAEKEQEGTDESLVQEGEVDVVEEKNAKLEKLKEVKIPEVIMREVLSHNETGKAIAFKLINGDLQGANKISSQLFENIPDDLKVQIGDFLVSKELTFTQFERLWKDELLYLQLTNQVEMVVQQEIKNAMIEEARETEQKNEKRKAIATTALKVISTGSVGWGIVNSTVAFGIGASLSASVAAPLLIGIGVAASARIGYRKILANFEKKEKEAGAKAETAKTPALEPDANLASKKVQEKVAKSFSETGLGGRLCAKATQKAIEGKTLSQGELLNEIKAELKKEVAPEGELQTVSCELLLAELPALRESNQEIQAMLASASELSGWQKVIEPGLKIISKANSGTIFDDANKFSLKMANTLIPAAICVSMASMRMLSTGRIGDIMPTSFKLAAEAAVGSVSGAVFASAALDRARVGQKEALTKQVQRKILESAKDVSNMVDREELDDPSIVDKVAALEARLRIAKELTGVHVSLNKKDVSNFAYAKSVIFNYHVTRPEYVDAISKAITKELEEMAGAGQQRLKNSVIKGALGGFTFGVVGIEATHQFTGGAHHAEAKHEVPHEDVVAKTPAVEKPAVVVRAEPVPATEVKAPAHIEEASASENHVVHAGKGDGIVAVVAKDLDHVNKIKEIAAGTKNEVVRAVKEAGLLDKQIKEGAQVNYFRDDHGKLHISVAEKDLVGQAKHGGHDLARHSLPKTKVDISELNAKPIPEDENVPSDESHIINLPNETLDYPSIYHANLNEQDYLHLTPKELLSSDKMPVLADDTKEGRKAFFDLLRKLKLAENSYDKAPTALGHENLLSLKEQIDGLVDHDIHSDGEGAVASGEDENISTDLDIPEVKAPKSLRDVQSDLNMDEPAESKATPSVDEEIKLAAEASRKAIKELHQAVLSPKLGEYPKGLALADHEEFDRKLEDLRLAKEKYDALPLNGSGIFKAKEDLDRAMADVQSLAHESENKLFNQDLLKISSVPPAEPWRDAEIDSVRYDTMSSQELRRELLRPRSLTPLVDATSAGNKAFDGALKEMLMNIEALQQTGNKLIRWTILAEMKDICNMTIMQDPGKIFSEKILNEYWTKNADTVLSER